MTKPYFEPSIKPWRMVWAKVTGNAISTRRYDSRAEAQWALDKVLNLGHVGFVDHEGDAAAPANKDRKRIGALKLLHISQREKEKK